MKFFKKTLKTFLSFDIYQEEKTKETNSSLNKNEENINFKVVDIVTAELSINDSSKINSIIDIVRMDQSILADGDEGFERDFFIIKKENNLIITGNLRTCLICLRHAGLLHPQYVEDVINQLEKKSKSPKVENEWQNYSRNFNQADKTFPIKYSVPYPRY